MIIFNYTPVSGRYSEDKQKTPNWQPVLISADQNVTLMFEVFFS